MNYKPFFNCPHCGNEIHATVSASTTYEGLLHGVLPLCGCEASVEAQEREHRIKMEARKRARRKK